MTEEKGVYDYIVEVHLPGEQKARTVVIEIKAESRVEAVMAGEEAYARAMEPLSVKVKEHKEPVPKEAKGAAPAGGK